MSYPYVEWTDDNPYITLQSGGKFYYKDPDNSDYTIEDIAWGLANTCRYTGQCTVHYSVAQHSLMMAALVPDNLKLEALMHDAQEAFMCDIPKPLKVLLPDYQSMEDAVELSIRKRYGLPEAFSPEVRWYDRELCQREMEHLFGLEFEWPSTLPAFRGHGSLNAPGMVNAFGGIIPDIEFVAVEFLTKFKWLYRQ